MLTCFFLASIKILDKIGNEFFLSTAFNEFNFEKSKIMTYHVDEVKSMGTPEELENLRHQYLNLICNKLNINDKTFPMPLASNNYRGVE